MTKWVGIEATRPQRFSVASHVPENIVRKIDFGLTGWSWVGFRSRTHVRMPNGRLGIVHEARTEKGVVVGLRDLTTCDIYGDPMAAQWRNTLSEKIKQELSSRDKTI